MALADALATYDRVALNLDKLDRVWDQMVALIPDGPFMGAGSPDEDLYQELAETWEELASSLPAINGWQITAKIVDYAAIGQIRLDYLDIAEPPAIPAFNRTVHAPGAQAKTYRRKLMRARQELVRQRAEELVATIDAALAAVPTADDEALPPEQATPVLDQVREAFNELERLLGDALNNAPRHHDLRRHLRFGEPHDAHDIATWDWPTLRPHIEQAVYGDAAPVPVEVSDLGALAATAGSAPVPSRVRWDRLDADGFERLLGRILEHSGSYEGINRLMALNSTDAGRDLEAYRVVTDGLLTATRERTIVQAKHWSSRSVNATEVADLVHAKLPGWEGEPVRRLIFATSGSFTQEAVRWIEKHNAGGRRPFIEAWSAAELEVLLRRWPSLLAEFGLID
ncbi:restriction endonuclease [Actinoplanes sp. NPDC051475]|uniref:restriction endonuclease n=1 Tax=Actinoplanes sp. NPDC051475 TaxID=3157225 RepID=UPI00344BCDC5